MMNDLLTHSGGVIANNIFGASPWYARLRFLFLPYALRWRMRQTLQVLAWKRNRLTVALLWHPETKDHLAVVNGKPLRLPHPENAYWRFIGLDFSTARRAYKLYQQAGSVDLTGYQTVLSHGGGVGMSRPAMPEVREEEE